MSWNSSTMTRAEAQLLPRRGSRRASRRRSRARSCRSSKSSADSRPSPRRTRRRSASSSSWSRSRSRAASSSSAACSTALRGALVGRRRARRDARWAPRSSSRSGGGSPASASSSVAAFERCASVAPRLVGQAPGRVAQLGDRARRARAARPSSSTSGAARGAQRLVDAREHPAQPVGAVGREQSQPRRVARRAQNCSSASSNASAAQHARLRLVELAEARVEPDRERIRLQQPVAEAVDGRDPGAVELAREVVPPALAERVADAGAQLAGRALRVRDHEDRVDVEAVVADRAHEALDEHARLAGAGARGDEDVAARVDRRLLLGVRDARRHARLTRHIGQRSHQAGQRLALRIVAHVAAADPLRELAARVARDRSTCAQNSSSSR